MREMSPSGPRYRFGPFELNVPGESLSRHGIRVKLQDLPYRLLVMLAERPGEIVTRDEIRQRLWPENTFVEFDNSLGVAVRKVRDALGDDADTPRYLETIPRRGYRFVAPVAMAEAETSSGLAETVPVPTAPSRNASVSPVTNSPARHRAWVTAVAVMVVVGAALYILRSLPRSSSAKVDLAPEVTPVRARRSVAVLGFRNLPGRTEDNWLSPAFAEMLNTELGAGGGLRMVSGEDVARAKRELPIADEDSLSKGTLERLHTNPGADVVVLGSYTLLPNNGENRIRLDIRVQDTLRGETIAEQAMTGSENNLFELASQAGVSLRQSLGIGSVTAEATNAARAALPSNARAARLYSEGRAKLWAYDFQGARDLLVKAVAADPNYPLAHSALSEALWHSGYEVKARGESERAKSLSDHLPEEQRLVVEGQYWRTLSAWPKAAETYQSLFHLFPDSLDYGLLLASAQLPIKHSDALHTLSVLRRLPSPSGEDARIDMTEASAWMNVDAAKARAAAELAIKKATAQGSHAIVERTYGFLCEQGVGGDSVQQAISDCENALNSSLAARDRNGEAIAGTDLGALYYEMGELARSEKMFREAIQNFHAVGNREGSASSLSNFGAIRLSQGHLAEARKLLEQSVVDYQAVEDKEGIALALNNLGELSRDAGNLEVALTTYQQAKATAQEIDDKDALAYVMNGLGEVDFDRGDLVAARKEEEEALALRKQLGRNQFAMETQVSLAKVSIEEGKASEEEGLLRNCKNQFHQNRSADDELTAEIALIRALLAEGKDSEARKEIDASQALAGKSQNVMLRLQFALASAQGLLSSDNAHSIGLRLDAILKDARVHGFVGVEYETELVYAQLAQKTGNIAAANERLKSLERSARARGFGLIAHKAAAARA